MKKSKTPRTDRETYTIKQCDIGHQSVPPSCARILENDLDKLRKASAAVLLQFRTRTNVEAKLYELLRKLSISDTIGRVE
jgi:hypothetical protein